jgi:hypothetical protein
MKQTEGKLSAISIARYIAGIPYTQRKLRGRLGDRCKVLIPVLCGALPLCLIVLMPAGFPAQAMFSAKSMCMNAPVTVALISARIDLVQGGI